MPYVNQRDAPFGTLKVVIFHVARQVYVGMLPHGVVDKKAASPTADGYAADRRTDNMACAQYWQSQTHLHLLQKSLCRHREGEHAHIPAPTSGEGCPSSCRNI